MANQKKNKEKQYPYISCRFWIVIDNVIEGGFSECSGLQIETEVDEFREGGLNDYVHRLPKGTKYGNIILKRGFIDSDEPWNWYKSVIAGKQKQRKNISIIVRDSLGNTSHQWDVKEAFPIKWNISDLKSDASTVIIETLEFVHRGFRKVL